MGGGQSSNANGDEGATDACDHTPIFSCFDKLGEDDAAREQAARYKEQVAGLFHRRSVPAGASIFAHKVGRRDLVIVELEKFARNLLGVSVTHRPQKI